MTTAPGLSALSLEWGLYTDLYELTMAQGYFYAGMADRPASFDYFFRTVPCNGGYVVFAGLADVVDALAAFRFSDDAIEYLQAQGFRAEFLQFLRNFQFKGSVYSVREGEIVFPNTPVMVVTGTILEAQLIETLLLNLINFQSLVATRACRISEVVGDDRLFLDFGLRRAQGLGGIQAARAAVIGGAAATSNVEAGRLYGLRIAGTMAHSWIQAFDDELEAFRHYARQYPDRCILLIDTYDTLRSGLPNAITVAKELERSGHRLVGVRIDSGDIAYLARQARHRLDEAGLSYVKIFASNQLDEYIIRSLNEQRAPIDGFGVGTRLVTSYQCPALDGVYKLSSFDGAPRLKISDDPQKTTLPGLKKLVRYYDAEGRFYRDGILQWSENPRTVEWIRHPDHAWLRTHVKGLRYEPLLQPAICQGVIQPLERDPYAISRYRRQRLQHTPIETRRLDNPHTYKVGVSESLAELRHALIEEHVQRR